MQFYLGCAVWSYKDWVGNFYPPKSRSQDFLRLYSQRLTAVEGNTTFYAVPEAKTVQQWATQTPETFQFCLKFPKEITHNGLLEPTLEQAFAFLERIRPLDLRLGPIFAQLPPQYSPEYLADLNNFLQALRGDRLKFAVEVRHRDWFREPHRSQLNRLLEKYRVGKVLLDSRPIYNSPDDPQINTSRRKPKLPLQPCITADFSLIRFISHPEADYNQSYLQAWVQQIEDWLRQGIQLYFFVHCPLEVRSPFTVQTFQNLLEINRVQVPPLPWNQIQSLPQQLSLLDFLPYI